MRAKSYLIPLTAIVAFAAQASAQSMIPGQKVISSASARRSGLLHGLGLKSITSRLLCRHWIGRDRAEVSLFQWRKRPPYVPGGRHLCHGGVGVVANC
jgi:hypothetical protein